MTKPFEEPYRGEIKVGDRVERRVDGKGGYYVVRAEGKKTTKPRIDSRISRRIIDTVNEVMSLSGTGPDDLLIIVGRSAYVDLCEEFGGNKITGLMGIDVRHDWSLHGEQFAVLDMREWKLSRPGYNMPLKPPKKLQKERDEYKAICALFAAHASKQALTKDLREAFARLDKIEEEKG